MAAPWLARVLIGLALVVAGQASAETGPKVPAHAIGGIAITGSAHASLGPALRDNAEAGLAGAALHVAAHTSAKLLSAVPELATCVERECLTRFATAIGADRVVALRVESNGELYTITVVVADARGRYLRRRQEDCVACAVPDVQDKVTALVRTAVGAATDDTQTIELVAQPPNADLQVDGVARGRGTWQGVLTAGPHEVVVTDPDARSIRQTVFVDLDGSRRFTITIPPVQVSTRRWSDLRWITAAAGATAVLTGTALLIRDGDGTCGSDACPELYELTVPGVITLSAGLALSATAAWMFWRDAQERRPAVALVPTDGGVAAGIVGRF